MILIPQNKNSFLKSACILCALGLLAAPSFAAEEPWLELFNGKNLDNWIIKFTGSEMGVNFRDTFTVKDNLLAVSYSNWPDFNNEFGHMFYNQEFSNYNLMVEYRFVGDQVTDGPQWAFRNNGMMLHSQDPASMTIEQEFPVSIEAQMLGGNGVDARPTGNVCTPGTNMVMAGELVTRHCTNSNSETFHGDQWVTMEVEVRGSDSIRQIVNGTVVLEYQDIQLDPQDKDAQALLGEGAPLMLDRGFISIQAESHPIEFRRIAVQVLD
jgi:hypothetical protein